MKKIISLVFITAASFYISKGQNVYDPYISGTSTCPYAANGPDDINGLTFSNIVESAPSGYTGEYQFFLNGVHPTNYWNAYLSSHAVTYKVEAVSFPFTPNCVVCQGTHIASPSGDDRTLVMPNNQFPYDAAEKAWVRDPATVFPQPVAPDFYNNYEFELRREFEGKYGVSIPGVSQGFSEYATLASRGLTATGGSELHARRIYYPHTILKHTFYIHCDNSYSSAVLDSFSFVLDHTRGRMSYYPFTPTYTYTGLGPADHDITIFPSIIMPPNWTNNPNYNNSDLADYLAAVLSPTINYFPAPYASGACVNNHAPSDISSFPVSTSYLRPAPFSLVQAFLGNATGASGAGYAGTALLPGIKQAYVIDQPIDLKLINPSEKIIYNPSDVAIDLTRSANTSGNYTLTFPSGYTFKTVSGVYPTSAQVNASDPNHLYFHPQEINASSTLTSCDDSGPYSDGYFSHYHVKSGSTLVIEPCVRLYDVKIEVEAGGNLYYDPTEISGSHYSIVSDPGGIIHVPFSSSPHYSTCPFNCYEASRYDESDVNINTNTTWTPSNIYTALDATGDGKIQISGTIVVHSGSTLNINGPVRIEFGENGKIVVQRNAKLIINGAGVGNEVVLTSAEFCQKSMWGGIQVLGNRFASQGSVTSPSSSQGYLLLFRTIIENARKGVLFGIDANNSFNGGVLNASLSTFRNNYVDIQFKPYSILSISGSGTVTAPNYAAQIGNCIFETTKQLNDPYYIASGARPIACDKHIILNGVRNVKLIANQFENSATNSSGGPLFDPDVRGTGIYSINSYVALNSGILANTFKGLSEGFWAISTGGTRYITIKGNHFINNIHGIVLEGTDLSSINSNDFTIPVSPNNSFLASDPLTRGYNKPVGLYLIGATNFTAQENIFDKYLSVSTETTSDVFNYGMVVNNCTGSDYSPTGIGPGDELGYVYKNKFSFVNADLQSELDNKGDYTPANGAGLEFKCNEFYSRISNDVIITGKPFAINPGEFGNIRDQGKCVFFDTKTPAGNQFYTSGCSVDQQIQAAYLDPSVNSSNPILYASHLGAITTPSASCIGSEILTNSCSPAFSATTSCPSNLTSLCIGDISCLYAKYNSSSVIAEQKLNDFIQLIDGGSTSFLIEKINSSMSPGQLKNLLMSKSPYLSDEVLKAMINRANPLPPGHVKQIVMANSPVTVSVLTAVQNAGLPAGILDNIMAAQVGISARRDRESEIGFYSYEFNLSRVMLEQAYLEVDNLDSLKNIAKKDTTLRGLFKLMDVLIENCDSTNAKNCLNEIIAKEGATSDKTKMHIIRMQLDQLNRTWDEMDSTQYATVKQIYLNNPETAINARAALSIASGFRYSTCPFDIPNGTRRMNEITPESNDNEPSEGSLLNYPNPFSNETIIKAILPENVVSGELVITDVLGKIISEHHLNKGENSISISDSNLNNGIYFYYMVVNGVKIKSSKMIKTK